MESMLLEVLEETRRFLVEKCTWGMANDIRQKTHSLLVSFTEGGGYKTPQLDPS